MFCFKRGYQFAQRMLQSTLQTHTKFILNNHGYHSVRRLGKGGFGHVLLATKSTSSTTCFAIKCISKKKMIKQPQLKRFLLHQVNTMAIMEHPNIVKLLKTFEDSDWYFLVMEYCDMGSLYSFVSKLPQRSLSLTDTIHVFKQVLTGLEQIHSKNIIHRDIKLENILLKRNSQGTGYICKIGDFGLARPIDNNQTAVTNCGTQSYMAPEILSRSKYGRQADIWSMGVLFYCLLFGDFPFKGINLLDEIRQKCKGGLRIDQLSKIRGLKNKSNQLLLSDFISRILQIDPNKRITIRQIMQHPLMLQDETCEVLDSPSNTTCNSQDEQSVLEWQCSRIMFIQKIVESVVSKNLLSFYLTTAFKFCINKVSLYFLNRPQIRSVRQSENNEQMGIRVNQLQTRIMEQLDIQYSLLVKNQHLKQPIDKFQHNLNTKIEDFAQFKMAYRNTVGRVYEQVHRKLSDNLSQRAAFKLKLFLCHIINRVFTGSVNPNVFPFYMAWLKKNNIKLSLRCYDFESINEWIKQQRPDNLQRSQDNINQIFYK